MQTSYNVHADAVSKTPEERRLQEESWVAEFPVGALTIIGNDDGKKEDGVAAPAAQQGNGTGFNGLRNLNSPGFKSSLIDMKIEDLGDIPGDGDGVFL